MIKSKIMSPEEAVSLIKNNSTVAIGGAGAGHAVPDKILKYIGKSFQQSNTPKGLTIIHPCGIGDNDKRGLNHIAYEGLIDTAIGGFWGNAPMMVKLAKSEKIRGYNLPQGVLSHLMRASASGKPGLITRTGLHTFVDPRHEGGKINEITKEDIVEIIELKGNEYLFYKSFPIDVAIIRGTSVDKEGNLTMEEEVGSFSMLSMAMAAKCNGGKVIAQVKYIKPETITDPGQVKVPGVFIDAVVPDPDQEMTYISVFDPALVKRNVPVNITGLSDELKGIKKIIARRAALELKRNAYVNLGYGIPDGVPYVAWQEDLIKDLSFMIEQGAIGGIPTTGLNFGAMYNPSAIIDDGYQFDFFQGGGLDLAFLGFAQVDQKGNVNSSRFGDVITGCGGSIDISQNAKEVIYCGSFAVKAEIIVGKEKIKIKDPGKYPKFVNQVQQISFSGQYALQNNQRVLYITERAVFELSHKGLILKEIAPGINLQEDVLNMMEFKPVLDENIKTMDKSIFMDGKLNLQKF